MFKCRTNLKEMGKKYMGAGQAIYKLAGETIADGIWEEFKVLVDETAQFTGSTAASWNVMAKGAGSFGGVRMLKLSKGQSPLQVGHHRATDIAKSANLGNLDDLQKKVLTSGINVFNESPGAQSGVPEFGPLRPENAGAEHAFARFKERVASKVFEPRKGMGNMTIEQLIRIMGTG